MCFCVNSYLFVGDDLIKLFYFLIVFRFRLANNKRNGRNARGRNVRVTLSKADLHLPPRTGSDQSLYTTRRWAVGIWALGAQIRATAQLSWANAQITRTC